jgi:hypothetical protein
VSPCVADVNKAQEEYFRLDLSEQSMPEVVRSINAVFGNVRIRKFVYHFLVPYTTLRNRIAKFRLRHELAACEDIHLTDAGHSTVLVADIKRGYMRDC